MDRCFCYVDNHAAAGQAEAIATCAAKGAGLADVEAYLITPAFAAFAINTLGAGKCIYTLASCEQYNIMQSINKSHSKYPVIYY